MLRHLPSTRGVPRSPLPQATARAGEEKQRMPAPTTRALPLALILSASAIAACRGGSLTSPGAGSELTGDISLTIRDEVEATVGALTLATSLTPIGTTRTPASPDPCVNPST